MNSENGINVPKLWESTNQLKDAVGGVQKDVAKLKKNHKELGKAFIKVGQGPDYYK